MKKFRRYLIRFDTTHERDRHTHTAWRHRPRLCIAYRGKNRSNNTLQHHSKVERHWHCPSSSKLGWDVPRACVRTLMSTSSMMFSNKFYYQNSDLLTYCVPTKAQKTAGSTATYRKLQKMCRVARFTWFRFEMLSLWNKNAMNYTNPTCSVAVKRASQYAAHSIQS